MNRIAAANVTPVRQRTQYSCMAASLMMCINAHGRNFDEDTVNKVMGAQPLNGASWENAIAAAQHFGFRVHMVVPATINMLKEWTDQGIPVMIAWNPEGRPWSHASVVFDVKADGTVYVADPNIPDPDETVRVVSKDEFYHRWYEKWPDYLVRRPALAIMPEITLDGRQVVASKTATRYHPRSTSRTVDMEGKVTRFRPLGAAPGGGEAYALSVDGVDYLVIGRPDPKILGKTIDFLAGKATDPVYGLRRAYDIVVVDGSKRAAMPQVGHDGRNYLVNKAFFDRARTVFPDTTLIGAPIGGLTVISDEVTGDVKFSPERGGWYRMIGYPQAVSKVLGMIRHVKVAKAPTSVQPKKKPDNKIHVDPPKPRNDAARALAQRGGAGSGVHHNRENDFEKGRTRKSKHPSKWDRGED